jgi:predicted amidophosphoribosyltransferase
MPLGGLAMRCTRCQNENPTDARFCNGWGAALSVGCARCGQFNPLGSRFCNGCGDPIGHPEVSAAEMRAERKDEDGERYVSAMTQGRAVSRI